VLIIVLFDPQEYCFAGSERLHAPGRGGDFYPMPQR